MLPHYMRAQCLNMFIHIEGLYRSSRVSRQVDWYVVYIIIDEFDTLHFNDSDPFIYNEVVNHSNSRSGKKQ